MLSGQKHGILELDLFVILYKKINKKIVGVVKMYQEEYKRWMAADLEDADLKPELAKIEGKEEEIKDPIEGGAPKQITPLKPS